MDIFSEISHYRMYPFTIHFISLIAFGGSVHGKEEIHGCAERAVLSCFGCWQEGLGGGRELMDLPEHGMPQVR